MPLADFTAKGDAPLTAAKAHREKSVTWKGSAITGIVDVSENETTEGVTKHRTDNATTTQAVFVDGVGCTIKATTTDMSLRGSSGYTIGATGALVIVKEQRAEGIGAISADQTSTYASATLVGLEEGTPINGRGTFVMTWEADDPAGTAVCAFT